MSAQVGDGRLSSAGMVYLHSHCAEEIMTLQQSCLWGRHAVMNTAQKVPFLLIGVMEVWCSVPL